MAPVGSRRGHASQPSPSRARGRPRASRRRWAPRTGRERPRGAREPAREPKRAERGSCQLRPERGPQMHPKRSRHATSGHGHSRAEPKTAAREPARWMEPPSQDAQPRPRHREASCRCATAKRFQLPSSRCERERPEPPLACLAASARQPKYLPRPKGWPEPRGHLAEEPRSARACPSGEEPQRPREALPDPPWLAERRNQGEPRAKRPDASGRLPRALRLSHLACREQERSGAGRGLRVGAESRPGRASSTSG